MNAATDAHGMLTQEDECIPVDDHWRDYYYDHDLDSSEIDFDHNDRRIHTAYSERVLGEYLDCSACSTERQNLPDFDGATVCAEEGQSCSCDGMIRFGYGSDEGGSLGGWSVWVEMNTDSAMCSEDWWGDDPNPGEYKMCMCAAEAGPISAARVDGRALTTCAAEDGLCSCSGAVRFGLEPPAADSSRTVAMGAHPHAGKI
eukprot:SAG31_NODE_3651_length_4025_cov_3.433520_6_plen_201_part_00